MPLSEESLKNELLHAAHLDAKQRGELAELAFMRKAATLGFAVAKPWGDSDRYDVVVRSGKVFSRVQIKSVWSHATERHQYRVGTKTGGYHPYTADQIDFLVAYIFAKDIWYVFPVSVVEHRVVLCVRPGSLRSRLEQYREAWKLMRTGDPEFAELTV